MWQVADAKNKFSELLTRAETEGPQRVSRGGRTFLVISEDDLHKIEGRAEGSRMTLTEFFMTGPSFEGLDLERKKSPMRPVDLE